MWWSETFLQRPTIDDKRLELDLKETNKLLQLWYNNMDIRRSKPNVGVQNNDEVTSKVKSYFQV